MRLTEKPTAFCIPVSALSLLRHGDGQSGFGHVWGANHGPIPAKASIRWRDHCRPSSARSARAALRRTDHVHRRTRPSRVFPNFDLSVACETGIMAGAPCPIEVIAARSTKQIETCADITIAYGMTENQARSAFRARTGRFRWSAGSLHRWSASIPMSRSRVVRSRGDASCRAANGANCARAATAVMLGYWDEPEKGDDRPLLDAQGVDAHRRYRHHRFPRVIANNRRPHQGNMVIRGGEKPLPARDRGIFSFVIRKIPGCSDLSASPTIVMARKLCAWIRPRSGETLTADEVRSFLSRAESRTTRSPRYVEFVDEFSDGRWTGKDSRKFHDARGRSRRGLGFEGRQRDGREGGLVGASALALTVVIPPRMRGIQLRPQAFSVPSLTVLWNRP